MDLVIGGFTTRVSVHGAAELPLLVLLHDGAYGTDGPLCWGSVASALADEYRVIVPDLLGWGHSAKVVFFDRSPYDPRLEHIAEVCRALCPGSPVFLAGVSFGAELAVRATIESRWQIPVRRAVAISGTGGRLFRNNEAMAALTGYTPSLEAARDVTATLVGDLSGLDAHIRTRYENTLIPGHWEAMSSARLHNPALSAPAPNDEWMSGLGGNQVPLCFVEGAADPLLESGWAAKMAAMTGRGSSITIDGGHEPNIDRPDAVASVLGEFFAQPDEAMPQ